MKFCSGWFNINLTLVLVLFCGCTSARLSKEELSTVRLFMEGTSADVAGQGAVQVTRGNIPMTIESEPILTEGDLRAASVVDNPDGTFAIRLNFDDHGSLVLDMMTTAHKGKHIIVFSQFPKPGKHKNVESNPPAADGTDGKIRTSAWLAAVLIRVRNGTGAFQFTPDATHAEAERIVRGLNNLVAEAKRKNGGSS